MNRKNNKRACLWLLTATLVGLISAIGVYSCNKADEKRSVHISVSGKMTNLELMTQQMSQIYYNVHHEKQEFDSCKVVEQDNGYINLVAFGTTADGETVKFAIPADKKGDTLLVKSTPVITCTCRGNCLSGCDPLQLDSGEYICTDCEDLPESTLPICTKSVSVTYPEPNQ